MLYGLKWGFVYLGGAALWVYKILTGHLDRLVCFGKLDGIHQTLMSCLTVGVRHTNQVCCLWGKFKHQKKLPSLKKKRIKSKELSFV